MLCVVSGRDHVWRIAITNFLAFEILVQCKGWRWCFHGEEGQPTYLLQRMRGVVALPDHFPGWIDYLGFSPIILKTKLDTVLASVMHRRRQVVDWSGADFKDPFFPYR